MSRGGLRSLGGDGGGSSEDEATIVVEGSLSLSEKRLLEITSSWLVTKEHIEEATRLVNEGVNMDVKGDKGLPPLWLAAYYYDADNSNSASLVKLLLENGADVNHRFSGVYLLEAIVNPFFSEDDPIIPRDAQVFELILAESKNAEGSLMIHDGHLKAAIEEVEKLIKVSDVTPGLPHRARELEYQKALLDLKPNSFLVVKKSAGLNLCHLFSYVGQRDRFFNVPPSLQGAFTRKMSVLCSILFSRRVSGSVDELVLAKIGRETAGLLGLALSTSKGDGWFASPVIQSGGGLKPLG